MINPTSLGTDPLTRAAVALTRAAPGEVARVERRAAATLAAGLSGIEERVLAFDPAQLGEPAPSAGAAPQLTAPAVPAEGGTGALAALVAELAQTIGATRLDAIDRLNARLKLAQQDLAERVDRYREAAAAFAAATDAAVAAGQRWLQADAACDTAQAAVEAARQALAAAPDDPAARQRLARADAALAAATQTRATARAAFDAAEGRAAAARTACLQTRARLDDRAMLPLADTQQQVAGGAAAMLELFATLIGLINRNADDDFRSRMELWKKDQESIQKDLEEKAAARRKQLEKQRAAQKGMSCAMAIVGVLLGVASVVAAPFTAGASVVGMAGLVIGVVGGLAGAAIGIADLVKISQGQPTLSSTLMKPVSDVMQQLVQVLGNAISATLQKAFGVPKDKAEQIGAILGGVIVGVLMVVAAVAIVVLARKLPIGEMARAVSGMAGKMLDKMLPEAMSQAGSTLVSQVGQQITAVMTRLAQGLSGNAMLRAVNGVTLAADVLRTLEIGANAGVNTASGVWQLEVADLNAQMDRSTLGLDRIADIMERLLSVYQQAKQQVGDNLETLSQALATETDAGRAILNRIGNSAAL